MVRLDSSVCPDRDHYKLSVIPGIVTCLDLLLSRDQAYYTFIMQGPTDL